MHNDHFFIRLGHWGFLFFLFLGLGLAIRLAVALGSYLIVRTLSVSAIFSVSIVVSASITIRRSQATLISISSFQLAISIALPVVSVSIIPRFLVLPAKSA
jgi:hypothetical protein